MSDGSHLPPESTHVALRDFIERIFDEREKLFNSKMVSLEKAMELAFKNVDVKMTHLNELRSDVLKDRSLFLTTDKYEPQHEDLRKQVEALAKGQGRWWGIAAGLSFVSAVIGGIIVKLFGL